MLLLTILGLEGAQILITQNTISVRVSYHGNDLFYSGFWSTFWSILEAVDYSFLTPDLVLALV